MNNRIDLNEFKLHDHCYSLVPAKTTPKVTIRHQQERAAKLAELLRSESGDKDVVYWVIGAGAAGLTFGATMCRYGKGNNTAILERLETPLWNLRGCFTRWLDPYIFSWPDLRWQRRTTRLPAFNWVGSYAHHVNSQFAWGTPVDLAIHLDVQVDMEHPWSSWKLSRQVFNGGRRFDAITPNERNIIIIASGPGLEQRDPMAHNASYWLDDNIERQDPYDNKRRRHIIILGNGDGAITDLIRTRIGLTHRDILEAVAKTKNLQNEIEHLEEKFTLDRKNNDRENKQAMTDKLLQLVKVAKEYPLGFPLRAHTSATLIASQPLGLNAFPINHFLLAYLLVHDDKNTHFIKGHGRGVAKPGQVVEAGSSVVVEVSDTGSKEVSKTVVGDVLVNRTGVESTNDWAGKALPDCSKDGPQDEFVIKCAEPLGRTVNVCINGGKKSRAKADIVIASNGSCTKAYKAAAPIAIKWGKKIKVFGQGVLEHETTEATKLYTIAVFSLHQHRSGEKRTMGVFRFALIDKLSKYDADSDLVKALHRGVEVVFSRKKVDEGTYQQWVEKGLRFECVDIEQKKPLKLEHGHRVRVYSGKDHGMTPGDRAQLRPSGGIEVSAFNRSSPKNENSDFFSNLLRAHVIPAAERYLGAAQLFELSDHAPNDEAIDWAICHRHAIFEAIEKVREDIREHYQSIATDAHDSGVDTNTRKELEEYLLGKPQDTKYQFSSSNDKANELHSMCITKAKSETWRTEILWTYVCAWVRKHELTLSP